MRKLYASYLLILYASFCVATAHLWGIVQETDDTDKDDDDVEAEPTTDEVIEPDIKTSNPTDLGDNEETLDPSWDMNRVIRDVAYFLRTHKFKDFDHRYYGSIAEVPKRLYQEFPKPPLRSLHWEVRKHCEVSFRSCLQYLERIVELTPLKRQDDTVTVIMEQSWDVEVNKQQIVATQADCERAKMKDNITADPFQGPIDSRECTMRREDNRDFTSLIKNQLNVTCACQEPGYEWSSRFGICVDIDECGMRSDNCSKENMKTCINLPGYYDCICSLGYVYSPQEKTCVAVKAIDEALHGTDAKKGNETETKSILAMIFKIITRSRASVIDSSLAILFSLYIAVLYH